MQKLRGSVRSKDTSASREGLTWLALLPPCCAERPGVREVTHPSCAPWSFICLSVPRPHHLLGDNGTCLTCPRLPCQGSMWGVGWGDRGPAAEWVQAGALEG